MGVHVVGPFVRGRRASFGGFCFPGLPLPLGVALPTSGEVAEPVFKATVQVCSRNEIAFVSSGEKKIDTEKSHTVKGPNCWS